MIIPELMAPVGELITYLDSHHISYWIDKKGMYASAQFTGLIADNICSSGKMICVSSKASNASKYTLGEVLLAFDEDKPIIPFRVDDTPCADNLKIPLLPLHRIDHYLNPGNAFNELLRAIGKTTVNICAGTLHNGHEYVDLGLPSGLLWATCNVGASRPSDCGYYFAYGETTSKSSYNFETYAFRIKGYSCDNVIFSKYVLLNDGHGEPDYLEKLNEIHDAAHMNWGAGWHMPTIKNWRELVNECDWKRCKVDKKKGYKVTGKDAKSIFLPADGNRVGDLRYNVNESGFYWSSQPRPDCSYLAFACIFFYSKGILPGTWGCRDEGLSIRPVLSNTSLYDMSPSV